MVWGNQRKALGAYVVLLLFTFLFIQPSEVYALGEGPCDNSPLSVTGSFFKNYEEIEYRSGLLWYHFRVDQSGHTGQSFRFRPIYLDDECNTAPLPSPFNVALPIGVAHWSARFISNTELQIWDDDNEQMLYQFTVPPFPLYASVRFSGVLGNATSGLTSRALRMGENAEPPPQYENTAEKSPLCNDGIVTGNGLLFDTYERAEYVNGLLRVHLRLKQLTSNSPFTSNMFIGDENCANFTRVGQNVQSNTQIPPFTRYYSVRFMSPTHWELWNDEAEEKITCAGCAGDIPAGTPFVFFNGFRFANIVNHHFQTTPFPPSISVKQDPVVIIPGILGSEKHNGVWVVDPILHTYDDLIATLDANGYTPEQDLFTFPYDWRKSNIETALLLKQKIDEVKSICECDKIDLVAHSMGGLVARQYIQSDAYEDDVDQLIFLGTPHLGAPKAYLMWEGGEMGPLSDTVATLMKVILSHEGYEQRFPHLFDYIRTIPIDSVRELLPTYDYIFDDLQLRDYPNNYPVNIFLENLNANIDKLLSSGVEIHNFVGEAQTGQTIIGINATDSSDYLPKWIHGYPKDFYDLFGDHGLIRGQGDETVPLNSASYIDENLQISTSTHGAIPDDSKGKVAKLLKGSDASELIDNFDLPNLKIILIKILSPADLLIIAPDGKKIGKDFDGQEVNEIPNAFYTGFGTDTEFITILNPLDGEYKIYTQGTGDGSYTVETAYIIEEGTTELSFTGNTKPGLATELNMSLDTENPAASEIVPSDTEPPVITITEPEEKDYERSEDLPLSVSAEDADSGVHMLETYLDNALTSNTGSIDLFSQSLGMHTLLASSTDNVGNATSTSREFRVIATHESTLSDLERAYQLGLMNELTYKVLKPLMTGIFRAASNAPKTVAPQLYKAILRQLDQRHGKGLNEQGYQLLKEDIEWLINNL